MKKILLTLCLFNGLFAYSQSADENQLLSGRAKKYGIYVLTKHDTAFLFGLAGLIDKAGTGSMMIYSDTLVRQPGNTLAYKGAKSFLKKMDDKFSITLNEFQSSKPVTSQLEKASKPAVGQLDINNGYWWKRYMQLDSQLATSFSMYNYTWRNGFSHWKQFSHKNLEFQQFAKLAEERLQEIKDSITMAERENTAIAINIVNNIATVDIATVKHALDKLTPSYEQRYFHELVNQICLHRPELFFPLAEALPKKKYEMFDVAYFDKKHRKTLGALSTDSPAKTEFFKRKKG
jgi:hypothetical protein